VQAVPVEDLKRQVEGSAVERFRAVLPERIGTGTPSTAGEYVEARTLLRATCCRRRATHAHANSVEDVSVPRSPADRLCQCPAPRHKMRVLREKHLLRETMKADLPPSIAQRTQAALSRPDRSGFLQGAMPDYVNQLMGRESLASMVTSTRQGRAAVAKRQRSARERRT